MKKIFRICDNPFDDREIINDRLAAFGAAAAARLQPSFPELAAPIQTATDAVTRRSGSVSVTLAERLGNTGSVDGLLAEIAAYMREAQPHVIVAMGADSAAYRAIYPAHRSTYTKLTKTDAPAVLEALKKAMENWGERLEPGMRATMAGFKERWDAVRNAQNSADGQVADQRSDRDEAREALEDALFDALLELSKRFKRTPEKVQAFFDHTLLDVPRNATRERSASAATMN